ncbi:MAG: hypothetical protein NW206_08365 [Hyphomonadaceae bacterium]|nr:hypothetical protein [Hyphomonadaceae bacterium]
MSRRPVDPRNPNLKNAGFGDRLGQARDDKKRVAAKFAQQQAARAAEEAARAEEEAARPRWNLDRVTDSVASLPLREVERDEQLRVSSVYQRLVTIVAGCINEGSSSAVMCWPGGDPSPSAVAVLLGLSDCASAETVVLGADHSFAPPLGVRALIYPYARTAHRALRHVYVDKTVLGSLHIKHQLRAVRASDDPALEDYHKTVARVSRMTGRALDGKTYAEILHPSLDDLMPSGPCQGDAGRSPLLGRIAAKTDLRDISRSRVADDPSKARFYLFGLRADEALARNLKPIAPSLSVVLLDLDYTGRNRLGQDWQERLKLFMEKLREFAPQLPVVALTDDPFTFDTVRFNILGTGKGRRDKRTPCVSAVLFAQDGAIAEMETPCRGAIEAVEKWEVDGFSGGLGPLLDRLRQNSRKARALGDREVADQLTALATILRRCASLPGPIGALADFIGNDAAAADVLTGYRVGTILATLRETHSAFAQHHPAELTAVCDAVEAAWRTAAGGGAMAPLLRDVVKRFKGVSSKTAVLFPKDMLAEFAASVLSSDAEFGEKLSERIERGMILFVDRAGFNDLAAQPSAQRNHIKTLIVVAAPRSSLLTLLAEPWLPDNVIVLADADALAAAARDTQRLSQYSDLSALAQRFTGFSASAAAEVRRLANSALQLSLEDELNLEELEFPLSGVIDLAGNVRPGQAVIHLDFDGGQQVMARPGTKLVVQDRERTVPVFVEVEARNVEAGDRVCVIGDAFLDMARPLLNISVRAAEEIRDYHNQVLERFARIEGATRTAKLAKLIERMGTPNVSVDRAAYWVKLEEQVEAPLHEVIPCAPQDHATFMAFARALGMTETAANQYWLWAVIAQRRSRLRAAMAFHDAYRSILVDVYAAQSENPAHAADVRRLRTAAENHVSVVRSKREVG